MMMMTTFLTVTIYLYVPFIPAYGLSSHSLLGKGTLVCVEIQKLLLLKTLVNNLLHPQTQGEGGPRPVHDPLIKCYLQLTTYL